MRERGALAWRESAEKRGDKYKTQRRQHDALYCADIDRHRGVRKPSGMGPGCALSLAEELRRVARQVTRDAEVTELYATGRIEEDIPRLNVAMDDAAEVKPRDR